jgi:hypothetical protein
MKISIALRIASLGFVALAPWAVLSDTGCPKCDCSHFPITDPDCAKCCFSEKGTVTSVSSSAVTVVPLLPGSGEGPKTFEIQKSTKVAGELKEGASATIFYHTAHGRNVATRINGPGFSHGLLVPGNLPSPPDTCEKLAAEQFRRTGRQSPPIPADAMKVFFGNSEAYSTAQHVIVWKIGGEDALVLQKTETGMLVSAKVRGPDGRLIAQVVDNEFFINPHNAFKIEGVGTSSLTVYDDKKERILEIEFLNPRVVKILGTFFGLNGEKITITEDHAVFTTKQGSIFDSSSSCFSGGENGVIELDAGGGMKIR